MLHLNCFIYLFFTNSYVNRTSRALKAERRKRNFVDHKKKHAQKVQAVQLSAVERLNLLLKGDICSSADLRRLEETNLSSGISTERSSTGLLYAVCCCTTAARSSKTHLSDSFPPTEAHPSLSVSIHRSFQKAPQIKARQSLELDRHGGMYLANHLFGGGKTQIPSPLSVSFLALIFCPSSLHPPEVPPATSPGCF